MCGICGKLSSDNPVSPELIQSMCDLTAHRGPDDQGVYVNDRVGLGSRRLAIQDLTAAGHMPMSDPSEKVWLSYNGEVYNFKELREELSAKGYQFRSGTDTEVVLYSYLEWGPACLNRFNGMFALAIWDSIKQQLFLARDRMGIKPLYYALDHTALVFASEPKAILADSNVKRKLHPRGMVNYFTFGHAVAPDTMFGSIKKLLPGHYALVSVPERGKPPVLTLHTYWEPPVPSDNDNQYRKEESYAERVYELLEQSVKRRMVADVPVGVFLSGGIDSSAITGLMSSLSTQQVKTFSIGFGGTGSDYNELGDARRVAEYFGTDHHELVLTDQDLTAELEKLVYHYDEPFADAASFPTYMVSKFARAEVPVSLSGEGSDEIFGGYRRYIAEKFGDYYRKLMPGGPAGTALKTVVGAASRSHKIKKALDVMGNREPISRYSSWFSLFNDDMRAQLFNAEMAEQCKGLDSLEVYRRYYPTNGGSSVGKALYLDQRVWLPDTYLEKVDKASMATSLEVRVPFLDHELVEFAATIPNAYKVKGRDTKHILKLALKNLLPPETLNKPKHGFAVPTDPWFKGPLKGLVEDALFAPESHCRQFFNIEFIQHLYLQHSQENKLYNRHLWVLLVFEMWCRRYGITA